MDRSATVEKIRLITIVKKVNRNKHHVQGYGGVSLFGEAKSTLIRHSTIFLTDWIVKYKKVVVQKTSPVGRHLMMTDIPYCQPFIEDTI